MFCCMFYYVGNQGKTKSRVLGLIWKQSPNRSPTVSAKAYDMLLFADQCIYPGSLQKLAHAIYRDFFQKKK